MKKIKTRQYERESLVLQPGGKLIKTKWVYDDRKEKGEYLQIDESEFVAAYLYEIVEFDQNVTLRDVFALIDNSDFLRMLLSHHWIDEYLVQYREAFTSNGNFDEKLECLELYWSWHLNSETGEYSNVQRPSFHGVGFMQTADVLIHDHIQYKAGERVNYSIVLTDIADMLDLPIRINKIGFLTEGNFDSKHYADQLDQGMICEMTLGQVLEGIFWELSFHGGPKDKDKVSERLKESIKDIEEGNTFPFEPELFLERDKRTQRSTKMEN